ncbi:hypothetical protein Q9L42_020590 (plasmid) [Methylomarinum sp. Ch1-1]|uniref:Uncharacterized protein n=1 Tax=Methylomarinum roseum TaxID=3067653 RepID=A0AAU7P0P1_9GAMM|nr:hypothetical protein [Methylomarinum sp. Ch1-1]MDP4523319.1 hypothetical protein [Methylomarinum sp. Ch1-1]
MSSKDTRSILELLPDVIKALKELPNTALQDNRYKNTLELLSALENASIPKQVAITLEGGLVTAVVSHDDHPIDVYVVDYDSETADDNELYEIPQGDGSISEASIHCESVSQAAIDLDITIRNFHEDLTLDKLEKLAP